MKKQTLEEVALSFLPNSEVEHDTDFIIGFEFGAKWQQAQAKEMEKEQREEDFINGYKARAELSGLIFDEFSELSAKELFNKTIKSE